MPTVNSLRDAANAVITSNKADKYSPQRFVQLTAVSNLELLAACSKLIMKTEALTKLYVALLNHPDLLTIEDFVARYGEKWGSSSEVINEARQRSTEFDSWVKHKRYN